MKLGGLLNFLVGVAIFAALGAMSIAAMAQTNLEAITKADIDRAVANIDNKVGANESEIAQLKELYGRALEHLSDADKLAGDAAAFRHQRENVDAIMRDLRRSAARARAELSNNDWALPRNFDRLSVEELQQKLTEANADLIALRSRRDEWESAQRSLITRPADASAALAEVQATLAKTRTEFQALPKTGLSAIAAAERDLMRARLAALGNQKNMLEQDVGSLQARSDIYAAELELSDLEIYRLNRLVNALMIQTGAVRTMNAEEWIIDAEQSVDAVSALHPILKTYAQENLAIANKLGLTASFDEDLPANEALMKQQAQQIKNDRGVVDQILASDRVSRSYGIHLRQLRRQQPSIPAIRLQIAQREQALQDALYQRIVNETARKRFSSAPLDLSALMAAYRLEHEDIVSAADKAKRGPDHSAGDNVPTPTHPTLKPLSQKETAKLRDLHDFRRELLGQLASFSGFKARKLQEVNTEQKTLLADVEALSTRLDQRLIWLPSAPRISGEWFIKAMTGIGQTFSLGNLKTATQAVRRGLDSNLALFIAVISLALVCLRVGHHTHARTIVSSGSIGRTELDRHRYTPVAVLSGLMRAVPWALIPFAAGLFLLLGARADPFVPALAMAMCAIGSLLFCGLTLQYWSADNDLFDRHFNVAASLRERLRRNLPWFLSVQILALFLGGASRFDLNYESAANALGAFALVISAIAFSVFAFRLYWHRELKHSFSEGDGIFVRYERFYFLITIMGTAIIAIFAAIGYYESARLVLLRAVQTFVALIAIYIFHGLAKRSMGIAQRRLSLSEEKAQRGAAKAAAIKAKEEGEPGDETALPPDISAEDIAKIDRESVSRQSVQLVNFVMVGLALAALWWLWSDLVPALSVFDQVSVWQTKLVEGGEFVRDSDTGQVMMVEITLWNLIQVAGIGLITWLGARNLPAFLDLFLLRRLNIQPGTAFAIVTILGYIIAIIGGFIAVNKLGTQWSQLQWIVAALGVGIGFGLQEIIANFISGIIILFERPVRIGDYVTIGDNEGTIASIQIRATTILDLDNREIFIPNKSLVTERVINWTLSNARTRVKIPVGIAYGSDTKKAQKIMLAALKKNKNILRTPEPTALFLGFGDSSLDFELRVFIRDTLQRFEVRHEIHMDIEAALRKAGIEIPFPQRDLHIRSEKPERPSQSAENA